VEWHERRKDRCFLSKKIVAVLDLGGCQPDEAELGGDVRPKEVNRRDCLGAAKTGERQGFRRAGFRRCTQGSSRRAGGEDAAAACLGRANDGYGELWRASQRELLGRRED
jgi:hypothetical protein